MSTHPRKVVITGLGATTPLGGDVESTWQALLAGKSGARLLPWDNLDQLPVRFAAQLAVEPDQVIPKHKLRRLDRYEAIALIAAAEAWKHAGYAKGDDEEGFKVDGERLGVVISSGIGGLTSALASYETYLEKGWSRVSPFTVP